MSASVPERKKERDCVVSSVLLSPPDHQSWSSAGGMARAPIYVYCMCVRWEKEKERERDCVVSSVLLTPPWSSIRWNGSYVYCMCVCVRERKEEREKDCVVSAVISTWSSIRWNGSYMYCMCVCVCVCVREREKERDCVVSAVTVSPPDNIINQLVEWLLYMCVLHVWVRQCQRVHAYMCVCM